MSISLLAAQASQAPAIANIGSYGVYVSLGRWKRARRCTLLAADAVRPALERNAAWRAVIGAVSTVFVVYFCDIHKLKEASDVNPVLPWHECTAVPQSTLYDALSL